MTITRAIAATAMLAGLAAGTACPAWADTTMNGHYVETQTNGTGQSVTNDWYVTPCGDGCASAVVNGVPKGQARLVNGQWTIDTVGYITCNDGTRLSGDAASFHRTWDPNTLAGTAQITFKVPACGDPAGTQSTDTIQFRQAP